MLAAFVHLTSYILFLHLTRDERKKTLSYDNMCHLNNLKVAKNPLPLLGDFKHLWTDIQKIRITDRLHITNHKDKRCKDLYNPEMLQKEHLEINTMCCEQIFAWPQGIIKFHAKDTLPLLSSPNGEVQKCVHRT